MANSIDLAVKFSKPWFLSGAHKFREIHRSVVPRAFSALLVDEMKNSSKVVFAHQVKAKLPRFINQKSSKRLRFTTRIAETLGGEEIKSARVSLSFI